MAEDPKPGDPAPDPDPKPGDPAPDNQPDPTAADVEKMQAALKKANKEAETHRLKLKELEDAGKSELERTTSERDEHKTARTTAELRALQLEVAIEKGLTATQAKRLIGTTRDELEADADELVASFKPEESDGKAPARRPTERLRGGGAPASEPEETDPRKLAAQIGRPGF